MAAPLKITNKISPIVISTASAWILLLINGCSDHSEQKSSAKIATKPEFGSGALFKCSKKEMNCFEYVVPENGSPKLTIRQWIDQICIERDCDTNEVIERNSLDGIADFTAINGWYRVEI